VVIQIIQLLKEGSKNAPLFLLRKIIKWTLLTVLLGVVLIVYFVFVNPWLKSKRALLWERSLFNIDTQEQARGSLTIQASLDLKMS
jgi:hypothetical protein